MCADVEQGRVGLGLHHHLRDPDTAEAGTAAGKREDGLDICALLRPRAHLTILIVAQAERLEVRPRLRERAEICGGVWHDGACEPHRELSQGAMREQRCDELCKGGVGSSVTPVAYPGHPALAASPLQCREGGAFCDESAEVVWKVLENDAGLVVYLGEGEGLE